MGCAMRLDQKLALLGLLAALSLVLVAADESINNNLKETGQDLWDEDVGFADQTAQEELIQSDSEHFTSIHDPPTVDRDAVATMIAKNVDTKVDPCEDFYHHACGSWIKTFKVPADRGSWTRSFDSIAKRVKDVNRKILENQIEIPESAVPSALMDKLHTFYKVCNDQEAMEKTGMTQVKAYVAKHVNQVKDLPSFMAVQAEMSSVGRDNLFSFGITTDPKHPLKTMTNIDQSGLSLSDRSYYLDAQHKKMIHTQYLPYVRKIMAMIEDEAPLKDPQTSAAQQTSAEAILAFETDLARITVDQTALRDPIKTYNKFTQAQLYKLSPVLKHYFAARKSNARFWKLSPELLTGEPSFLKQLNTLLHKTPLATLRAYLQYHLTSGLIVHLSDKQSYPVWEFFDKQMMGINQRTPRWERCYYAASSQLRDIMGRAFVAVSFKGDSMNKAESLIHMLEATFKKSLDTLSWLDDHTRDQAKIKLGHLVDMVGYPAQWHSYSRAILSKSHLDNVLALDIVSNQRNLNKLGKPVDKTEWNMSPATVNAYYSPETNSIVFPAAILQSPFFDDQFPMAMNFGGIGFVMGHELTHGYDDEGHLYDKNGALKNWWEAATTKRFNKRAQCIKDQYSKYKLPGSPPMFLNGNLTVGENLADNGGVQTSLKAYQAWAAHQPGGMPKQACGQFSGEKVFFYAMAQAWCTKTSVKAERMSAITNVHSPSEIRINGPLRNTPDFAAAFKCPQGSKMNPPPQQRCPVWWDDPVQVPVGAHASSKK